MFSITPKTLVRPGLIAVLALFVAGFQAQSNVSFDRIEYNRELSSVAKQWTDVTSDQNAMAAKFVELHNSTLATFPKHVHDIVGITHRVASRFGIRYMLTNNRITSAMLTGQDQGAGQREAFMVVEEMPRFPGCEDLEGTTDEKRDCANKGMLRYLYEMLTYPEKAKTLGLEGIAIVQFVVEPDGLLSDIEVIRGLGHGCDEEVIRVIESMNAMEETWIAGRQRGIAVPVQFTLPVRFRLPETRE